MRARSCNASSDAVHRLLGIAVAGVMSLASLPVLAAPEPEVGEAVTESTQPEQPEPEPEPEPEATPPEQPEPPSPDPEQLPVDEDADEDVDEDVDEDIDETFEDDYDPLRDSPEARTARRWLGAGIGATVAGSILVGGSIALSQTAPCDPLAGNNCFVEARDRAAVTMGVPGAILLLGGVAMTIVGALQRRSLRRGVAVVPTGTGIMVVGRF